MSSEDGTRPGQYILIQYKDGTDSRIDADDDIIENAWEGLTEDPTGIQYAAHYVPKRSGNGHRVAGYFGIPRDEQATQDATRAQEREQATERALSKMYASRDWSYNGHNGNHL